MNCKRAPEAQFPDIWLLRISKEQSSAKLSCFFSSNWNPRRVLFADRKQQTVSLAPFCTAKCKGCVCQILKMESLMCRGGFCLSLALKQAAWVGSGILSSHFYFTAICWVFGSQSWNISKNKDYFSVLIWIVSYHSASVLYRNHSCLFETYNN